MGPQTMLPLLLMKDDSDNENLIFMLMMSQNKPAHCEPITAVEPDQPVKTVYRTWRVNADGIKTLIDEE